MNRFGQRWKAAREAAGLSTDEAGRLAGYARGVAYKLEKEDDGVTLRAMKAFANVYGVPLAEIFREDAGPERVPSEFRPLLEPLLPFTQQQRESIVRNIASNLSFMAMQFGSVQVQERRPPSNPEEREDRSVAPVR